jgi:hypothetical protein
MVIQFLLSILLPRFINVKVGRIDTSARILTDTLLLRLEVFLKEVK